MPDIKRASVGGEDAIGVARSAERRVVGKRATGDLWTVPVERWMFHAATINLTTASDNSDRARVYMIRPSVRETAGNGSVRDLFPDYSSEARGRGARTHRIGTRPAGWRDGCEPRRAGYVG